MSRELGSRYVLAEVLGRGATGEVWRGQDRDGTTVACKLLHDSLARDPEVVRRFVQERAILTGLDHPNLVRMRDLVVEGDTLAIVMDHVAGQDLRTALAAHGTLPPGEACRLGADVAAGLAAAHDSGVVHRDVKPENVLLDTARSPAAARLTDFGIAKIAEPSGTGRTTLLAGTPQYIAPELFDGQPPTPAVDLYALGILLYELCCGVTPYAGDSALAVLRRHAEHAPGRPDGIPDPLWEVITGLLAKDPQARLGPAARVSNTLAALAHDLAAVPAAPARSQPPESVPIVHSQPTELGTQPLAAAAPAAPPAGRPSRRRRVLVASAIGVVAAVALGIGAAAAINSREDGTGGAEDTPAPAAAGDPSGQATAPPTGPASAPAPSSGPELMPQLAGMPEARARGLLPDGVEIEIVREPPPPGTPDGVVLEQDPPEGELIGDTVTLTVSGSETTIPLVELERVDESGDPEIELAYLSGERYPDSLVAGYDSDQNVWSGYAHYDLGRNFVSLTFTGGLNDNSLDTGADVVLEVLGDGQTLHEEPLVFGEPAEVEVDVSNVLRLELRWTYFDSEANRTWTARDDAEVVLGTPVLRPEPGYDPREESREEQ